MSNSSQPDLELFGRWQTDVYVPPPAVDVSDLFLHYGCLY